MNLYTSTDLWNEDGTGGVMVWTTLLHQRSSRRPLPKNNLLLLEKFYMRTQMYWTYTYIHAYIYIYVYIYIFIHIYVYIHMYVGIYTTCFTGWRRPIGCPVFICHVYVNFISLYVIFLTRAL